MRKINEITQKRRTNQPNLLSIHLQSYIDEIVEAGIPVPSGKKKDEEEEEGETNDEREEETNFNFIIDRI